MKAADYMIRRLAQAGIDTVFLVQGGANSDLIDAFTRTDSIKYVCPMTEQAAGFAAEGWAKVSGKPGCVIATSGPGGQNLITAIANAYYDSVPMIFITGQVNSRFMAKNPRVRQVGFQEWPMSAVAKHITKASWFVPQAAVLPDILERALAICQSGRPGPVVLDIPIDVQRGQCLGSESPSVAGCTVTPLRSIMLKKARGQIQELISRLRTAKRPIILVGGGAQKDTGAIRNLIHKLGVPAVPTWNALDIIPSDFPLFGGLVGTYGGAGRNFAVQNCDFLLSLGSRISGRITGGNVKSFARNAYKVYVEIDPTLADPTHQELPADMSINIDLVDFCEAVHHELSEARPLAYNEQWVTQVRDWKNTYDPVLPAMRHPKNAGVHPYLFARALSDAVPENAIIVGDCGGNIVVMNHAFRVKNGQRYFTNNGNSPMGFSMAAAIGAWFAAPERPIICVIGDGGFMMNLQEIQTIINYDVKIKVFVLNNGIYGISRAFQDTHFEGRHSATGPDGYSPVANIYHLINGFSVIGTRMAVEPACLKEGYDVEAVIETVMDSPISVVCDVACPDFCDYFPAIKGWNTPIEDMSPLLPRDEFNANMLIEPLPGWEKGEY